MADISFSPVSIGARRYAAALFAAAGEAGGIDAAAEILRALDSLAAESADFRRFIASPLYNAATQMRVMAALAQSMKLGKAGAAGAAVSRFLGVLAQHRRLFLLPEIARAFAAKAAEARGDMAAHCVSAEPLSPAQEQELQALLLGAVKNNRKFGKYLAGGNLILHKRADPALLGGFIVRCGSLLIDTSLRTKLSSLKNALKEVG